MSRRVEATGGVRRWLVTALVVCLLIGAIGSLGVATATGGNPAPTVDPGDHNVSLTDGDGTINATFRLNQTSGTVNVSYAGGKQDTNVSYSESAKAIQLAVAATTTENDTVRVGAGIYNGTISVDSTDTTVVGTQSRSETVIDAQKQDDNPVLNVTADAVAVRRMSLTNSSMDGISAEDDLTVTNVNITETEGPAVDGLYIDHELRPKDNITVTDSIITDSRDGVRGRNNISVKNTTIDTVYYDGITSQHNLTAKNLSIENFGHRGVNSNYADTTFERGDDIFVSDVKINNSRESYEGDFYNGKFSGLVGGENLTVTNVSANNIFSGVGGTDDLTATDVTVTETEAVGIGGDDNTTVTDATIKQVSSDGIRGESDLTVTNVTVAGIGDNGIEGTNNLTVTNASIRRGGNGIKTTGDNATATNVNAVDNWGDGIRSTGTDNTYTDIRATDNRGVGVNVRGGDTTLHNVTSTNNVKGVYATQSAGRNLTVRDITTTNNSDVGISLVPAATESNYTRIVDTRTVNNTNEELLVRPSTNGPLNGTNITVGNTTFTEFDGKNVSVAETTRPSSLSSESRLVSLIGNVTNGTPTGSYANVTFSYTDSDASGLDEARFAVYENDTASSLDKLTTTISTASNTVQTNITTANDGFGFDTTSDFVLLEEPSESDDDDPPSTTGGGGGVTDQPEDDETDDPDISEIVDQLSETEPDTETEVEIEDTNDESDGVSVETGTATEMVDEITFDDDSVSGTVHVEEYTEPPEDVTQSVTETVAEDVTEVVESDDETGDDETTDSDGDGTTNDADGSSEQSGSVNVVSVADISRSSEAEDTDQETAATVTMSVARDELDDPDNAVIVHETDTGWEELETTVQGTSSGEVTLEAQTESFSLFAVAETTASVDTTATDETNTTDTPETNSTTDSVESTDSETPGFGPLVAVVALVTAALLSARSLRE